MCIFTHVSHMLNICSTCVVLNMCLTHVDIFPVYTSNNSLIDIGYRSAVARALCLADEIQRHLQRLPSSHQVSPTTRVVQIKTPVLEPRKWNSNSKNKRIDEKNSKKGNGNTGHISDKLKRKEKETSSLNCVSGCIISWPPKVENGFILSFYVLYSIILCTYLNAKEEIKHSHQSSLQTALSIFVNDLLSYRCIVKVCSLIGKVVWYPTAPGRLLHTLCYVMLYGLFYDVM